MVNKVILSERKIITTTNNSNDIKLIIILIIIFLCTDDKKSKVISYSKVLYIYSKIIDNENNCDYNTKNIMPPWSIEDIKPLIIQGEHNKLWNIEIRKNRISLSRGERTNEIYNSIINENSFKTLIKSIEKHCKITLVKLDKYKLAWS